MTIRFNNEEFSVFGKVFSYATFLFAVTLSFLYVDSVNAQTLAPAKPAQSLRIATYNVSLNRNAAGKLFEDLKAGSDQAAAVAAIIRAVQPDILLLNEIDYSAECDNARLFAEVYLAAEPCDVLGGAAWRMKYRFAAEVNTGTPSGLDLDLDKKHGEPEDAYGFGRFPGHYGMALLSRFEIATQDVVTLQNFLWSQLPDAIRPINPETKEPFYDEDTWSKLRLSSKSFWDVPIKTPHGTVHILASHPTPPAFDGPEDRNGCRNHDEIKLIELYIESSPALKSDKGEPVAFSPDAPFVVLGDLNCDPSDGDSRQAAIKSLLNHSQIAKFPAPRSEGAVVVSKKQAKVNLTHRGDPAEDTADFADNNVGNLRADYALPSRHFQVIRNGVVWPNLENIPEEKREIVRKLLGATDHHLVWVDVQLSGSNGSGK